MSLRHSQVSVDDSSLHVVEAGDPGAPPFVFLHGWPECWRSWQAVMDRAAGSARAIAIDLPGIGRSTGDATDGTKSRIAAKVHGLVQVLGLKNITLVGQDIGGMVVYAYLRAFHDLRCAVIMDVFVPGLSPWDDVRRNPDIWHLAMHSIPALPERLVQGRQADYFDYFYDLLSLDPTKITREARAAYVEAYARDAALTAGFGWYRAFPRDVIENTAPAGRALSTPLLYLRGEQERGGAIATYVEGFRASGVASIESALVPSARHFTQEEAPDEVWGAISAFAGRHGAG